MKTKLNLLLTAVMLLLSTNVFAQSGSIDPGKGDVNGDGVVDVADITAVASIMRDGGGVVKLGYFYLGTTAPTAENYRALPGVVTSFTSIDEAVGTEATVAAGQTLYMLCPTAWVTGKSVAVETQSGKTIDFLEEIDNATVSGYSIYKTQVLDASSTVTLKTPTAKLYFSVGSTAVTASNYTDVNNPTTAIPTATTYTATTRSYVYILAPSDKTVSVVDNADNAPCPFTEQTNISIPGHKVYKSDGMSGIGGTMRITLSDSTSSYFSIGTTPVTASNYTTANNATTTIPTTYEFTNNSGARTYVYVLIPSTKSISSIKDKALGGTLTPIEQSVSIPNHKVYQIGSAIANNGTIVITIQ